MPKFGNTSFSRLSTCHLDLQTLFYEVVRSYDCTVLEGHRNEADQNAAFERGDSKLKWPDGKHNSQPSMAVDVAPYPLPSWGSSNEFIYFAGYVMGIAQRLFDEGKMTHRVRYGGDWNQNHRISDDGFKDYVHFELVV